MGSKIGIVLAFLLSVAAAGGSYYLYQGLVEEKTIRGTVEAKYDQVKEKIITVQSEKEQFKAKSEEYRGKAEAMQSQLEKLQAEQSRIDSEKNTLETQLKGHQGMIAELQKKVEELEKKAKDAQAACGVTPADLKTDPLAVVQPVIHTPTVAPSLVATGDATSEGSKLSFKPVTSGGATEGSAAVSRPLPSPGSSAPAESIAPKEAPVTPEASVPEKPVAEAVEPAPATGISATPIAAGAKVLTVNRKFNFVVINQGLQDGLKIGDKLDVMKQGKKNATIQVEKLYDKFSAATLTEEDPKQQVMEGDEIRKI